MKERFHPKDYVMITYPSGTPDKQGSERIDIGVVERISATRQVVVKILEILAHASAIPKKPSSDHLMSFPVSYKGLRNLSTENPNSKE